MTGWRKRQVLEMAEQAGMLQRHNTGYDIWIPEYLEEFAELVRADERERIFAEQLQLPEPRLTGKFSITAGKFKCTGCTGTWTDREDAKHHLCKDYQ